MFGMIKTTTHDRIVAEKDAEIAGLMKRLRAQMLRNAGLQARLFPFVSPRARNEKGQFVKGDVM